MHQKAKIKKKRVAVEDSMCEDVIIGILSRLPAKSLIRFKSVCKAWQTLIKDPFFIKKQMEQSQRGETNTTRPNNIMFLSPIDARLYSLDIESLSSLSCNEEEVELADKVHSCNYPPRFAMLIPHLLGSCNGLVCIKLHHASLCLLNPWTRTYNNLKCNLPKKKWLSAFGFGYDAKIKDYKLVNIITIQSFSSEVMVLTLGSNAWRRLSDVPYRVGYVTGKLINEDLHWIDHKTNQVICFDVEEEEFKVVSRPVYYNATSVPVWTVSVAVAELEGCLAVVCNDRWQKQRDVEVWVMKEYGLEDSWTKMFSINPNTLPPIVFSKQRCSIKALCILKNNEWVLLLIHSDIVLYNLKSNTYRHIHRIAFASTSNIVTYTGSLINLAEEFAN